MENTNLLSRIQSFSRWHYQFDLNGYKTPVDDPSKANRHQQRKDYFFAPLVDLLGGSLAGKRVLDLGCNAGFWSLCAIESGCDYVLGIDVRQMHIDQANLVFETKGIDRSRYDFRTGNIFEYLAEDIEHFDIVLCLGLLYHVNKHVSLLEAISKINTDILVVDTSLSTKTGTLLEFCTDDLSDPRNSGDYELIAYPTHRAVLQMVQLFGYETVTLQPGFTSYAGADDYERGWRRAYLCTKQTSLAGVSVPTEEEVTIVPTPAQPPVQQVPKLQPWKPQPISSEDLDRVSGAMLVQALTHKLVRRFNQAIGKPS